MRRLSQGLAKVTRPIDTSANTTAAMIVLSKIQSAAAPKSAPMPTISRKKSPDRTSAAISAIPPMSHSSAAMAHMISEFWPYGHYSSPVVTKSMSRSTAPISGVSRSL